MTTTSWAEHGMVVTTEPLASAAGVAVLRGGGNAADAAVAAGAVLAVTSPMMCGMGGDLFALVAKPGDPTPYALNGSGRAGSGSDPARLRQEGYVTIPDRHDIRAVTVPGCVDGWVALHDRFGCLPLSDVVAPAVALARDGFPFVRILQENLTDPQIAVAARSFVGPDARLGDLLCRPGMAAALEAVAAGGRDAHYLGSFGEGLLALGGGEYRRSDLEIPGASWVEPVRADAWGVRLWTVPPNSQGYLTLLGAAIAERLDLPDDADDPAWAHLLIEAARAAGHDRPTILGDGVDTGWLFEPDEVARRAALISPHQRADLAWEAAAGDTTHLCVVDEDRMAVSMTQSNAAAFGSLLVEPVTGIELHNRGVGFSLRQGHPSEYNPGRRPPHTLSPALITEPDGGLRTVLGAAGGDAQPQVLLQCIVRLVRLRQLPGQVLGAQRWALGGLYATGFDTWTNPAAQAVQLEVGAPAEWAAGLRARGHHVDEARTGPTFGQAQIIDLSQGMLAGAPDPRMSGGAAVGY